MSSAEPSRHHQGPVASAGLGEAAWRLSLLVGALAVLMLFSGTILHFQLLGLEVRGDIPSGRVRLLMMGSYVVICLLVATEYRAMPATVLKCAGILAFVGFLILSTVWSVNGGATFRAGVALGMTTMFAAYLVTRYGAVGTARLYLGFFMGLIVLSVALVFLAPGLAVHQDSHAGAWRGYFTHKNVAGKVSIWVLPVAFYLLAAEKIPKWLGVGAVLVTIGFIVMTQSKTSLVVAMSMVALYAIGHALRRDIRATAIILLTLLGVAALVAFVLLFAPEAAVSLLGKDATFTGRTFIWSELQYLISTRPYLGHGYSAVWDVTYGPLYRFVEDWQIASGHNSYLDLLVDVGVIGTGFFLLLLLDQLRKAFVLVCYGNWAAGIFGLMCFLIIIMLSFSETIVPKAHNPEWMFLVIAFIVVRTEYAQWRRGGTSQA